MKSMLVALALCAATFAPLPAHADTQTRDFVVNAVTELFIERDVTAIDRYWAEDYAQRNPALYARRG